MTPVTAEQVEGIMRRVKRLWTQEDLPEYERRSLEILAASHEAMRKEWAASRVGNGIARRHADGWHPEFALDPKDSRWVPWNEGEPEELTAEQYEWFQAAWADRHARKAEQ